MTKDKYVVLSSSRNGRMFWRTFEKLSQALEYRRNLPSNRQVDIGKFTVIRQGFRRMLALEALQDRTHPLAVEFDNWEKTQE